MKKTESKRRDDAARRLAELQVQVNPSIHVYRVLAPDSEAENSRSEPIKLLYVNEFTFPSGEIWPLGFEPTEASGNYATIIMDITPAQFDQLQHKKLKLPHSWRLGDDLTPASSPLAGQQL